MKTKILAAVLAGALAVPSSAGVGFAGSKAKSGGKAETKLEAELTPAIGSSVEDLEGKIKYKKKTGSKGTEEEIDAKVESTIPNAALGITDENAAADQTFLLKIFQGATATEKGSCVLLIKEIEFEYEEGVNLAGLEAEYGAKVKEKIPLSGTATLSKKVGTCQVLALISGVPTAVDGVPDVIAGDTAAIYALTPTPGATPLLVGVFDSEHSDDDDDDD